MNQTRGHAIGTKRRHRDEPCRSTDPFASVFLLVVFGVVGAALLAIATSRPSDPVGPAFVGRAMGLGAYMEGGGPPPTYSRARDRTADEISGDAADKIPTDTTADAEVVPWGPPAVRASSLLSRLTSAYAKLGVDAEVARTLLADETSPQGRAYDWIVNFDGRKVGPDDDGTVQRYVLAVFFFSTGGDGSNGNVSAGDNGPTTTGGGGSNKKSWKHGNLNFLSESDECQWFSKVGNAKLGVKACNAENQVTEVFLPNCGLVGTMPLEIGLLSELSYLDMGNNGLKGVVPDSLGRMEKLAYVSLTQNEITGTVPESWGGMLSLEQLLLHYNDLTGMVPPSVCSLRLAGALLNVWTDCSKDSLSPVKCTCCTVCCDSKTKCGPKQTEKKREDDTR